MLQNLPAFDDAREPTIMSPETFSLGRSPETFSLGRSPETFRVIDLKVLGDRTKESILSDPKGGNVFCENPKK